MTEQQLSLASIYAGWNVYQQRLVAAIAPLTSEQLAFRSSPQTKSVGEIAAHIVASRIDHFHLWMGEGSRDLAALAQWHEEGQPARSASELVTGLENSWHVIQHVLTHRSIADLAQAIPFPYPPDYPDPIPESQRSRSCQWIIWHVLQHDMHHGGELSNILGAHNLAAVDLD